MNKMEPKVSCIVPAYNVCRYVRACLDSILAQDFKDIEVICVDDGSTDGTSDILDEYARRDQRISVIHTENHGLSAARNVGLLHANGVYVWFVDSDDALLPRSVGELVGHADKDALDQIVFLADVFLDPDFKGEEGARQVRALSDYCTISPNMQERTFTGAKAIEELLVPYGRYFAPVQWRFLRRSVIVGNGLLFPEGLVHEDEYFTPWALVYSKRVRFMNQRQYRHRVRQGSIMTSVGIRRGIINRFLIWFVFLEKLKTVSLPQDSMAALAKVASHFAYSAWYAQKDVELTDDDVKATFAELSRRLSVDVACQCVCFIERWREEKSLKVVIGEGRRRLAECDLKILSLAKEVSSRDERISTLSSDVMVRDERISALTADILERMQQIQSLTDFVADREDFIGKLKKELQEMVDAHKGLEEQILALLGFIQTMKERKSAKIGKLFLLLRHPELASCKSVSALLRKIVLGPRPLAEGVSLYSEIEKTLVKMLEKKNAAFSSYAREGDFAGSVCIFASVPYDDIGGGQRSAQFARCLLSQMYQVKYFYCYPKVEAGIEISNEHDSDQFSHKLVRNLKGSPFVDMREGSVVLFELPHPTLLPFLKMANDAGMTTVYERIDPWEMSLGDGWYDPVVEDEFIRHAKKVVATAYALRNQLVGKGRTDVIYNPNAADTRYFHPYQNLCVPRDFPRNYSKNILYFGSMYGDWFDWEALNLAASENPNVGFLMIGDPPSSRRRLPTNVLFLGMRKNSELAAYLRAADAAMIPFIPGPLVDAVSPIKIFEYLFVGKPVFTFRMPELDGYPGVSQANTRREFSQLCSLRGLCTPESSAYESFMSVNTWNARLETIVPRPKLRRSYSIITLIHNNERIIERHLNTLLAHLKDLPIEVIVVDNASTDKGPELVRTKYAGRVTLVKNPKNGCASGRNLGARNASNDVLVFFDSDQWFTSVDWLFEYDHLAACNDGIGAYSWAAGWFENERLGGPIMDYLPARGTHVAEYERLGYRTDVHYLGTGCFFIEKALFMKIGGLDEFYDPTIFEDTDLSLKVREAGYKIAYRDFQGIMHQPHQTTRAGDNSKEYKALWIRNLGHFKKKWAKFLQPLNLTQVLD